MVIRSELVSGGVLEVLPLRRAGGKGEGQGIGLGRGPRHIDSSTSKTAALLEIH